MTAQTSNSKIPILQIPEVISENNTDPAPARPNSPCSLPQDSLLKVSLPQDSLPRVSLPKVSLPKANNQSLQKTLQVAIEILKKLELAE